MSSKDNCFHDVTTFPYMEKTLYRTTVDRCSRDVGSNWQDRTENYIRDRASYIQGSIGHCSHDGGSYKQGSTDHCSPDGGSFIQGSIDQCSHDGGSKRQDTTKTFPQTEAVLYRAVLTTVPQTSDLY